MVFLESGVRLQGTVTSFGSFSVLLSRGHQSQVVYDQAISTFLLTQAVQIGPSDKQVPAKGCRPTLIYIRGMGRGASCSFQRAGTGSELGRAPVLQARAKVPARPKLQQAESAASA